MGIEQKNIDTKAVEGRKFRIPYLIGEGSGRGFKAEHLHIPFGWQDISPHIKQINWTHYFKYFEAICDNFKVNPDKVEFDSHSGLLISASAEKDGYSGLITLPVKEYYEMREGIYQFRGVQDIHLALALYQYTHSFLRYLWSEIDSEASSYYAHLDGELSKGYYPVNLRVPKDFQEQSDLEKNPPSSTAFHLNNPRFSYQACSMAGRFGLTLETLQFDSNGLVKYVKIEEGDACDFFQNEFGEYNGHNIDTPYQGAALFGIVSQSLNGVMRKKYVDWY